jgi:spermidine/putrescine transport system permease protein
VRRLGRTLFVGVPLAWVALAHLGPLVAMARISLLADYPGRPGAAAAWSVAAFAAFLANRGYQLSLMRSLLLAAAAALLALVAAYPLAYHVALKISRTRRAWCLMLLIAPFWTSEVLRLFGLVLLAAHGGAMNAVLRGLGLAPLALLYGTGAVLAGLILTVFPIMLLALYAALDRLPAAALAAARTLGARAWVRLVRVTLPLTVRGVAAGVMLTCLACLGLFAAPALLGGPTTPVFATVIVDLFGAASGRWPMGAAFGFILLSVGTLTAAGLAALVARLAR